MCFSPFLKAAGHSFASLFLVAEKNRGTGYFQSEQPALKQWGTGTARQGYGYDMGTGIRHNQQQTIHGTVGSTNPCRPLCKHTGPPHHAGALPTLLTHEETTMERSNRWRYIRRIAWDRDRKDRAPCHICGQPIDYFLRPSSCDDAWEPDHVIPVAKRKDLELDLNNIKASHRRCNRARGDGSGMENELGMQSRVW